MGRKREAMMLDKTKVLLKDAIKLAPILLKAEKHDCNDLRANTVPKKIGVYLFRSKKDDKIVYVGRALGQKGLYGRVVRQHLHNNYIKSVFRLKIAKQYRRNLKEGSVTYIKDNFVLSFLPLERNQKELAAFIELILIYEYQPKYNTPVSMQKKFL